MGATGVYWKPVWHVLDDGDVFEEILLVNPAHIKNVPGRKTDVNDATWIGQLLECGLLRGSFVPPAEIGQLREITRYRRQLTEERSREVQRLHKLLEDANVKLTSVATHVLGVTGRMILDALCAGERDPDVLAGMAKGQRTTEGQSRLFASVRAGPVQRVPRGDDSRAVVSHRLLRRSHRPAR